MKKIISLLVALLTLAACSDTLNEGSSPSNKNGVEDGGITLTINLPDFSKEELTRAGEKGLTSLNAVAYDNDKNFLFNQKITSWEVVSNGYKVKVPVRNKATMIQLVANAGDLSDTQCQSGLDKAAISGTINKENPVCWGMISVSDLMKANPEISLLRQFAKVNVKYEKTTSSDFKDDKTFELESFQLYDAADKGTIAPKDFDYNAAAVNVPADAGKANSGWQTGETPFYETAAGQAYLIVKGKYNSVESYYKVAFLDNKTKDAMPLLRNHAYTVKITHVNTDGWPTEAEAIKDPYPENRMMVDVKDDNPLVTDMIACKDYHLGVSDQVSGAWDDENIIATVVTTIKNGETPTFSTSGGWIKKGVTINKTGTVPDTDGPNSTTGKKYEISIAVEKNEYSEEPRTGTVTVKSGDLTRTITVTQKGKDFKLADDRKVKLVPITSTNVGTTDEYNDYFNKFLLNTLGIKPEDMQKEKVRNDGLHFGVGTNEFSYLIPKKVGDVVTKGTYGDKFNITDNGDRYWKVTLNSGADNYEIWTGDFTITYQENGHDIAIKYPVYHCGLFHKIDASNQQPPVDQSPVSGRFYYGVVKVKGKSKTYVMLDRNLGASSDRCYAPGTKALEANKGAIGGYFHIAKEKQNQTDAGNIINNLPQGFTIPENSVFQDIIDGGNLKEETRYTLSGEAYNIVEIITTDNSALPVIYLPATGYVEGEAFRNVTHVSLWTRTLLSGNQGFDTTSPEYGFWYRYLDVYGKICTMSNLRFVSGNAGKNTGTYRAMPIRLVHVLNTR
mgnify:FL=1